MGAVERAFRSRQTRQNGRQKFPQQNGTAHGFTDWREECEYLMISIKKKHQVSLKKKNVGFAWFIIT